MIIRPATLADAALLSSLGATTFYDTFRPFHSEEDMQAYIHKAYDQDLIAGNLANTGIAYFISGEGANPTGYIKLLRDAVHPDLPDTKNIELEKIYVLKDYLGSRHGHELMNHAITYSRNHGFEKLFLGVWQENHRAVSFYRRAGFAVIGTRTFVLGSQVCEDFIMCLNL